MSEVRRSKSEYGGYLPLELNMGREYFSKYDPFVRRFNSVKAGIDYLIRKIKKRRIYLPYYYCPSTTEAIRKTGIEICFYHIDEWFAPKLTENVSDSIVLIVDYFGICAEKVQSLLKKYSRADLILDRAHNFFEEPIKGNSIHNVYSAKKFFGVPDGAYVVSDCVLSDPEKLSDSYEYANYLLLAYEEGVNVAYNQKRATDQYLDTHYAGMSKLAKGLLGNINYQRVKDQRKENYKKLRLAFEEINELALPDTAIPYQFPLLLKGKGYMIKKQLVDSCIYVPTLWSGKELQEDGNVFERNMMSDCIFLPVDQRYCKEDMEYFVAIVRNMMNENT